MENSNVILEDIKNLRRNVKGWAETAERLSESVFSIKQLAIREKDNKSKKMLKEALDEIKFQICGLRKDIEDLEDSDLFRDKIDIPKHKR